MAGMDPKILAAVFASIAALAVGTGGTSVDDFQNMNPENMVGQFFNSGTGFLENINKQPVPENSVKVSIQLESDSGRLSVQKSELRVSEFRELISPSKKITSDESISFKDFTGNVKISRENETLVSGSSNGFSSSGVNFTKKLDIDFRTNSELIEISDISRTGIKFDEVDVKMRSEADETVIQKGDSRLSINSFSGGAKLFPQNMTIVLDGKVDSFEAGGTSFTG